jgi:transcription initiation factor TFIID TATA-box-binding protein
MMRKRTYTALEDDLSYSLEGGGDVSTRVSKHKKVTEEAAFDTLSTPLVITNQNDAIQPVVAHQMNHPSNLKMSDGIPSTVYTADDDIPLTIIHNLVGTCEISSSVTPIDLQYVYSCLPNSFYDRKRFAAITIRVTEPVCTALLFTSGKLVLTGSKSLIECTLAALKVVRMLQRHIPTISFTVRNAVIQNVVAHVVLPLKPGQRLNIDRLYEEHSVNATYQRNLFVCPHPNTSKNSYLSKIT